MASVPLLTRRTCSQLGTRSQMASASFISRAVGAPYDVPAAAAAVIASTTFGWAWPRMMAP